MSRPVLRVLRSVTSSTGRSPRCAGDRGWREKRHVWRGERDPRGRLRAAPRQGARPLLGGTGRLWIWGPAPGNLGQSSKCDVLYVTFMKSHKASVLTFPVTKWRLILTASLGTCSLHGSHAFTSAHLNICLKELHQIRVILPRQKCL